MHTYNNIILYKFSLRQFDNPTLANLSITASYNYIFFHSAFPTIAARVNVP